MLFRSYGHVEDSKDRVGNYNPMWLDWKVVIGVPHDKWGETAKAIVVPHLDHALSSDELRAWCRERLAGFKCPTAYEFISDAAMPRTATGKILHRALRERYSSG